jgi:predicted lipoprotein with Yx(FWY)xxD motif
MKDKKGRSACYGSCASYWPPLMKKGALRAGSGVKAKLLGTTKRKNGKLQVTYNRHPLYLYISDTGAGQTSGQGLNLSGGKWYVVSAGGAAIKAAPPVGGGPTTTYTYPTYP